MASIFNSFSSNKSTPDAYFWHWRKQHWYKKTIECGKCYIY